jgi:hypothetical protein
MALVEQFGDRVVSQMVLDDRWKSWVIAALKRERPQSTTAPEQMTRIESALSNLRKQHKWGHISDEEYMREWTGLERQLKLISPREVDIKIPNLERGAELLGQMRNLWHHPGVTDHQREELVKEVFRTMTIEGKEFMTVEPKPQYAPLFASIIVAQKYGSREPRPPPSPPRTQIVRAFACSESLFAAICHFCDFFRSNDLSHGKAV